MEQLSSVSLNSTGLIQSQINLGKSPINFTGPWINPCEWVLWPAAQNTPKHDFSEICMLLMSNESLVGRLLQHLS